MDEEVLEPEHQGEMGERTGRESDASAEALPVPGPEKPGDASIAATPFGDHPVGDSEQLSDGIAWLVVSMSEGFETIRRELGERRESDRFKEEQINRLHDELQVYRRDLVHEPVRLVLRGLIRLHDDLGRMQTALRERPAEQLTVDRFFQQFQDFQDDIEVLLGEHGAERFEVAGDTFDPHCQTALRIIPADDPQLVGRLAKRLRPGFRFGDKLLQKERVAVYAAGGATSSPSQGDLS